MTRKQKIALAVLSTRRGRGGGSPRIRKLRKIFWVALISLLMFVSRKRVERYFLLTLTHEEKIAVEALSKHPGRDGKFIDLDALNHGRKNLTILLDEVRNGEAMLLVDRDTGEVFRFAMTLRVYICAGGNEWLCQAMKRYQNGEVVLKLETYAVSETWIRGENVINSAIRGLYQELKLEGITKDNFDLESCFRYRMDTHPSSAYTGLMSRVIVYELLLRLPARPEAIRKGASFMDTGVEHRLEWVLSDEPLVDIERPGKVPEFGTTVLHRLVEEHLP